MASKQKEIRKETIAADSVLAKHSMGSYPTKEGLDGQRRMDNQLMPKKVWRAELRRRRKLANNNLTDQS